MNMNRRELLVGSSLALGTFFSASTLQALAEAATQSSSSPNVRYLSDANYLALTQISEIIMPRTDTPGAIDAGVAEKMDEVFAKTLKKAEQQKLLDGFVALNNTCQSIYKKPFLGLSNAQQIEMMKSLNYHWVKSEKSTADKVAALKSDTEKLAAKTTVEFFGMIKTFTLLIFFRSQPGATQVLQYVAIPGRYNARAPLKEIGKTWATN